MTSFYGWLSHPGDLSFIIAPARAFRDTSGKARLHQRVEKPRGHQAVIEQMKIIHLQTPSKGFAWF